LFILFVLGWKYISYTMNHSNIFRSWHWQLILFNLWGLQTFLVRMILRVQLIFFLFVLGWKYIKYAIQHPKMSRSWDWQLILLNFKGITDLSRAYCLKSSFHFFFLFVLGSKYKLVEAVEDYQLLLPLKPLDVHFCW
jgi:hypothetical protein